MALRPEPGAFQTPTVEDVTHQIHEVRFGVLEKVQKELRLTTTRPEVNVGDKDRSEFKGFPDGLHVGPVRCSSQPTCRGIQCAKYIRWDSLQQMFHVNETKPQCVSSDSQRRELLNAIKLKY